MEAFAWNRDRGQAMNRRDVLKIGMGAVALAVGEAVVLKNAKQQDVLVLVVGPRTTSMQCESVMNALKHAGIEAVLIKGDCEPVVMGQDRTFFSAGKHYGNVKVHGELVERVRWCETSLGLVAAYEIDRSGIVVSCYGPGAVTFEPLSRG